jgi:hypothetical protein
VVKSLRVAVTALSAVVLVLASPLIMSRQVAEAHPLHTSLAELSFDPRSGIVSLSLRVFVDDFTAASNEWSRRSNRPGGGAALAGYSLATFLLNDASGRRVAMTPCGGKRVGDLMWLCFHGRLTSQLKGATVSSNIMFEKYRDQINIVQASYEGRKTNLLFTPGDGPKKIP